MPPGPATWRPSHPHPDVGRGLLRQQHLAPHGQERRRHRPAAGAAMKVPLALLLLAAAPAWAGPSPGNGGARWGAGYFPNVPLVTHEGKKVRFFDDLVAGKVVVI